LNSASLLSKETFQTLRNFSKTTTETQWLEQLVITSSSEFEDVSEQQQLP
jgi:hypothetical protein